MFPDMHVIMTWKKFVLVGVAVAALAAHMLPYSELLGLNTATASIDQSISQNNDGCTGRSYQSSK